MLTEHEDKVLKAIARFVDYKGYTPSVRELCQALGLSAPSTIHHHLTGLIKKGYLRRHGSRALEIIKGVASDGIPILGRVPAGPPVSVFEDIEGYLKVSPNIAKGNDLFCVEINGDSMEQAGIFHGDLVIVKPAQTAQGGDIVVARLNGEEFTVKRLRFKDGEPFLHPANPKYKPFSAKDAQIAGIVVSLIRRYSHASRKH